MNLTRRQMIEYIYYHTMICAYASIEGYLYECRKYSNDQIQSRYETLLEYREEIRKKNKAHYDSKRRTNKWLMLLLTKKQNKELKSF